MKYSCFVRTNEELASKLALKGGVDQNLQKQIDDNINKINQLSRGTGYEQAKSGTVRRQNERNN